MKLENKLDILPIGTNGQASRIGFITTLKFDGDVPFTVKLSETDLEEDIPKTISELLKNFQYAPFNGRLSVTVKDGKATLSGYAVPIEIEKGEGMWDFHLNKLIEFFRDYGENIVELQTKSVYYKCTLKDN